MIYFVDFDGTIADTSITQGCVGNYKEKQKLIPQFIIFNDTIKFINKIQTEGNEVFVVSGNVGSTIKKAIKYFNLPLAESRVIGYRQGMPMQNLKRKIAVIQYAIKQFNLTDIINEITYIGDDIDDEIACKKLEIKFINIKTMKL